MRNAVIFHHLGAGNADEDALRIVKIHHGAHVKVNGQHAQQDRRALFMVWLMTNPASSSAMSSVSVPQE